MNVILCATQRWDGEGGAPGLPSRAELPVEARVLGVARAWEELEQAGATDEEALANLAARAGSEFDPAIVAAATKAALVGLVPTALRLRLIERWAS